MAIATIRSGRWRYTLSETDILWAARMVEGETIDRDGKMLDALAVLWTMTTLFSPEGQHAKYGGQRYRTFAELVRAYSQPINPRWLESGEFCRPGGRSHGSDMCSPDRLAARARLQRTPWDALDPELRLVVKAWAEGRTKNPVPGAIEFAADYVAQDFVARNAGSSVVSRIQNTFVATAASKRTASSPTIETSSSVVLPIVFTLALASLGGSLAWVYTQRPERIPWTW